MGRKRQKHTLKKFKFCQSLLTVPLDVRICTTAGGRELLPAHDELPGHKDDREGGKAGSAGAPLLLGEDCVQRSQR